jgi:hemerythrin
MGDVEASVGFNWSESHRRFYVNECNVTCPHDRFPRRPAAELLDMLTQYLQEHPADMDLQAAVDLVLTEFEETRLYPRLERADKWLATNPTHLV